MVNLEDSHSTGDREQQLHTSEDEQGGLLSFSFQGLLWTQFLGAANDNALRWLVIGFGKQLVPPDSFGWVLMAGTICFVLPYLLLAAPAGYLADRFSKRNVIIYCKVGEVILMAFAATAIYVGSLSGLMVVLAMMGSQSALFGPSKLGSIPEMLPTHRISSANGLIGLATVVATVMGTAVGNILSDLTTSASVGSLGTVACVLISIAVVGCITSLGIKPLPIANPKRRFPWNAVGETWKDLRLLASHRALMRVALGIMFFWSIGSLANMNIDQFAAEGGTTTQSQMTPLLLCLVLGVGVGSILAGIWSAGRVELGILPLGAAGIAISSVLLFTVQSSLVTLDQNWTVGFIWSCLFLFMLGTSAGLFDVPLSSYLQHESPPASRGSILAASNLVTFSGVLVAAMVFGVLRMNVDSKPLLSARQIFLCCGVVTLPVMAYIVYLIPQASLRFLVWLLSKTIYRIKVYGAENIPAEGGALLLPNHISWIDGVLLLLVSVRPVRMVVYAGNFRRGLMQWLGNLWEVILLPTKPKALARTLRDTRQLLEDGSLVCVFPEGRISQTGQMQSFKRGAEKIHKGTNVPVIPVYLDELWGSIFSFERGRFFWKLPRRLPYPISIHIGRPLTGTVDMHRVRQAVQQLGAEAVKKRVRNVEFLPNTFLRRCKQRKFAPKVADTLGADLTGGQLLMRTWIVWRLLQRKILAADERYIGVLLPPLAPAVITNAAIAMMRRVSVNLNYTVCADVINHCIAECGIQHVLTSRKFVERLQKMGLETERISAELVYLEDLKDEPTWGDKLAGALASYVVPGPMLVRWLGLNQLQKNDVLTVIFTSGSTGQPKGVMLTHGNIRSNIDSIETVFQFLPEDVLIGVLPFFHSFGYTVTLWGALAMNVKGVYHSNPLESKQVGKLCRQHRGSVLMGTPTFLRSYLRRCTPEDFATLSLIVAGAEKLPADLCDAYEKKFKLRPVEGYGATELSPLVSVNIPASRALDQSEEGLKEGSVGRPIPGVTARIVDLESGETLNSGESGMLLVNGPNVMKGYLNRPDITNEVIQDSWYVTGDVARIDDDGFIWITGRESRFSKIGGEMVPHIKIEETLWALLADGDGQDDDDEVIPLAVTAVPDAKKGERLVIVHSKLAKTPDELCTALAESGMPNIYVPSPDSFVEVDSLPLLGSGKLDLKQLQQIAEDTFGAG